MRLFVLTQSPSNKAVNLLTAFAGFKLLLLALAVDMVVRDDTLKLSPHDVKLLRRVTSETDTQLGQILPGRLSPWVYAHEECPIAKKFSVIPLDNVASRDEIRLGVRRGRYSSELPDGFTIRPASGDSEYQ